MSDCKTYRDQWVAFLSRELAPEDERAMSAHLGSCRRCRSEVDSLRALFGEAESFREETRAVLASVDWETLPSRIAARLPERPAPLAKTAAQPRLRAQLWSPRLRPALAGLLVGLLLGGLGMFFALRRPSARRPAAEFFASGEFLDRVELEMARRQTLDYLDKSQYLFLDVLERSGGSGPAGPDTLASQEARELISRKKYLNPQLDKFGMAKAKDLCDQIEILVFELSQLSPRVSAAEVDRIRAMVRDRQLLMKIRLVKKELERSEV
jgi:hypothetical protein